MAAVAGLMAATPANGVTQVRSLADKASNAPVGQLGPTSPAAPPLVTKFAQPPAGTVVAGNTEITYTVVVTAQAGGLTGLVITDVIPANTTLVTGSASGTGSVGATNPLTLSQPALSAGNAATLTFRVKTNPATTNTVITNTATVEATGEAPVNSNAVTHAISVPGFVTVTLAPNEQVAGGPPSTLTVTVADAGGNPIFGQSLNAAISPTARGTLSPLAPTNLSGQTNGTWTPGTASGSGAISINAGEITVTLPITVTPGPVAAVNVQASPAAIVANGTSTSVISATATDQYGNVVPNAPVSFTTSLGSIAPPAGVTGANGVATATLTSTTTVAAATVQATSNGRTGSVAVQFTPPSGQIIGQFNVTPAMTVTAGGLLTYTFVLTNNGPTALNGVGMIASVPAGTAFVSVTGGVYGGVEQVRQILPSAAEVDAVLWTGNLAAGESHTIVYVVRVTDLFGPITASAVGVVDAVELYSSGDVVTPVIPRARLLIPFVAK
jgi:adhesin/invasin